MKIKAIYEDEDLLTVDKPAGIVVFSEKKEEKSLINCLIEGRPELKNAGKPPRYGIAHRLDKDTSGVLVIAKNNEALDSIQKQFKNREVSKKYLALVVGNLKDEKGIIETLIGRSPKDRKKQKAYIPFEPGAEGKRTAITEYKVLERFEGYAFLELSPKTGRKHQIRAHLAYLGHPIAGDKMYGFKNQANPKGLKRQFLHASELEIIMPDKQRKGFKSPLPEELKEILNNLKK